MNDLIPSVRTEGDVELDGESIYANTVYVPELRKRVGMVFQKPNPFPMSVRDNIAFGPKQHGKSASGELSRIVETSLESVGLWNELKDKLGQPAQSLSPGQQQRLCIARLLAVGARSYSDGRAVQCSGSRGDAQGGRLDAETVRKIHDRCCYSQHGTGCQGLRQGRLFDDGS